MKIKQTAAKLALCLLLFSQTTVSPQVFAQSSTISGVVTDTTCPAGVTNLSAAQSGATVTLTWVKSVDTDVAKQILYTKINGGAYDAGADLGPSVDTTDIINVINGATYEFKIETEDASGNRCTSNATSTAITTSGATTQSQTGGVSIVYGSGGGGLSSGSGNDQQKQCPLPVENLVGALGDPGTSKINLNWDISPDPLVTNQVFYIGKHGAFSPGLPLTTYPTSIQLYNLDPGTEYTLRIQTLNKDGFGCDPESVAEVKVTTLGGPTQDNGNVNTNGSTNNNSNGNYTPPNPICWWNGDTTTLTGALWGQFYSQYCYPSIVPGITTPGTGDGAGGGGSGGNIQGGLGGDGITGSPGYLFGDIIGAGGGALFGSGGGGSLGALFGDIIGGSGGGTGIGGGSGGGGGILGGSGGGTNYGSGAWGPLGYFIYGALGNNYGGVVGGSGGGTGGDTTVRHCIVPPKTGAPTTQSTEVTNQNTNTGIQYRTETRRTITTRTIPAREQNLCIQVMPGFTYCAIFTLPPITIQEVKEEQVLVPIVTDTNANVNTNTNAVETIVSDGTLPPLPEGFEYCQEDKNAPDTKQEDNIVDNGNTNGPSNQNTNEYNDNVNGGRSENNNVNGTPGSNDNTNGHGDEKPQPKCFDYGTYTFCFQDPNVTEPDPKQPHICNDALFGPTICLENESKDVINKLPILTPELIRSGCPVSFDLTVPPQRRDYDGDGLADSVDPDDDNDGYLDYDDAFPYDAAYHSDFDKDCIPDIKDPDWDNDKILNEFDNCPKTPNFDQLDSDRNGTGDACDTTYQCKVSPVTTETIYGGVRPFGSGDVGTTNVKEYDVRSEILKQLYGYTDDQIDADKDGMADYWEVKHFGSITVSDGTTDYDGDGLIDLEEYYMFTDPTKADTDGDGLSDFEETRIYYTDPNSFDTDGDALSDYLEVKEYQTNPLAIDTDSDGFFDGMEITSGTDPLDSNSKPVDKDGDFIDDNWVKKYFPQDVNSAGLFESRDGKTLGTRDSDEDGLSDMLEYWYGTDPLNRDTDGDGYLDGEEVIDLRTDPRNANDPSPEAELRITNWKNGDISSSPRLLIRGKTKAPNVPVTVYAVTAQQRVVQLGVEQTDDKGKFALLSDPLPDGQYFLYANVIDDKQNILEESDLIQVVVDTLVDLQSPDPRRLSGMILDKKDLLQNLSQVTITDRRPSISGVTAYGSIVTATFQSLIFSSSLVADSPEADFNIRSPQPLEPGNHKVSLYAENVMLGLKSDVVVVPFRVESSVWAQVFQTNVNTQMFMLLMILLVLIAFYAVLRRSFAKDAILESQIEDLEEENKLLDE